MARRAARLLCAMLLCFQWGCSDQTARSVRLPGQLEAHVKRERFQAVTSVRGLPIGVRDGMRTLWGFQALDIADPDARPSGSDGNDSNPVSRQLVAAGCSRDHCLVYYQLTGQKQTHRVVLFRW